jgi:hypothetical protein
MAGGFGTSDLHAQTMDHVIANVNFGCVYFETGCELCTVYLADSSEQYIAV